MCLHILLIMVVDIFNILNLNNGYFLYILTLKMSIVRSKVTGLTSSKWNKMLPGIPLTFFFKYGEQYLISQCNLIVLHMFK